MRELLPVWLTDNSYANPQLMREMCPCSYSRGSIYKIPREPPDASRKWLILNNPDHTTRQSSLRGKKQRSSRSLMLLSPASAHEQSCHTLEEYCHISGHFSEAPLQFSQWVLLHPRKHSSSAKQTAVSKTKTLLCPIHAASWQQTPCLRLSFAPHLWHPTHRWWLCPPG